MTMITNNDKGIAFERWVVDVLRPYSGKVKHTKNNERFDIYFSFKGQVYIVECKCFSMLRKNNRLGQLQFKKKQMRALQRQHQRSFKDKVVVYICGVMLTDYDIYSVVIPIEKVIERGKQRKGKKYVNYRMTLTVTEQPLREWIGEVFGVDSSTVCYPEFREYMKQEILERRKKNGYKK